MDKEEEIPEINLGPLMDIIFILLLFFMVSTSFVNERSFPLERPQSSNMPTLPARNVRLFISQSGILLLNGREIPTWALLESLQTILAERPASTMLLVSDKRVTTGQLIAIADICRQAGFTEIAVATEEAQR